MAAQHCDMPCSVPPHPDLLARTKAELLRAQGANDLEAVKKASIILNGEKGVPGMNDGSIVPRSHYTQPTSVMAMSASGLERKPLRGSIRVIIVLVNFEDIEMESGARQRVDDLWFSTDHKIPTGSVTEYFSEVSSGAVSLTGEVIGPFRLGQKLSYYSNRHHGRGWPEPNTQTMANDAFEAAIGSTDFKRYDNDGNRYVDAFVVVHAGRAAEESGYNKDIWSVKWTLPKPREADGVQIYGFLTVAEDAKCGVCAHEIGHLVFGWPDLYEADHTSSGVGNWCLMGFGSWAGGGARPVHPSAWCKAQQGWIETISETEDGQITLRDVKTACKTHRLWTNGDPTSREYFLIENRQLTGFDKYLPSGGLLIWHIDDEVWSNTDESHPKVKLMQADGVAQLKGNWGRGDAGDVWPGFSSKSTFGTVSNPNSKAYSGLDTYVSVTNIPASSPCMTFDVKVWRSDQAPTGDFNPKIWYRLHNHHHSATPSLDVINENGTNSKGHIEMAREGDYSGQYWQIKSNRDGTYALRTMFLGPDRQLDVYSRDKYTPVLQKFAHVTGQHWQIKPWGDGTWHLENAYTGQFQYLDTVDGKYDVKMRAADAARPTQRWTITPVRPIEEPGF